MDTLLSIPLSDDEIRLVQDNLEKDTAQLALAKIFQGKHKALLEQIRSRQKARHKLPDWFLNQQLIFPPTLSVEQASSQATALYKASLVKGKSLVDLTIGMGIDSYFLSKKFENVVGYELQPHLAAVTSFNMKALGASHIQVIQADGISSLQKSVDWIYLDPARRDQNQRKVIALSDCTPDISAHLPHLLMFTNNVLVKTSPVMDIDLAIASLSYVKEVHVVGFEKECKEVLYLIQKGIEAEPQIIVPLLNDDGTVYETVQFTRTEEQETICSFNEPQTYLYEPHPAVLKSGAFKILTHRYNVSKIAPDSHLYTSKELVLNFPGRKFKIKSVTSVDTKSITKMIPEGKANLTIRNFPSTVNDLRKKLRLKEGGHDYLFATTLHSGKKTIIITEKLS